MEIVIGLFILFGCTIGYSAWRKSRLAVPAAVTEKDEAHISGPVVRHCLSCGFEGEMQTWIANNVKPKIILVLGFALGYIPGLIFLVYYWGKFKCPKCEAVGKNSSV